MSEFEHFKVVDGSVGRFDSVTKEKMTDLGFKFGEQDQIAKEPEYVFYVKPNGSKAKAKVEGCYFDEGELILKLSIELNSDGLTSFEAPVTNRWLEKYSE